MIDIVLFIVYSVLNASTGLTFMAFCAGMNPASNPEMTKIARANNIIDRLTLGLANISTGPLASNIAFNPYMVSDPKMIPTIPDTMVKNIDSNKI